MKAGINIASSTLSVNTVEVGGTARLPDNLVIARVLKPFNNSTANWTNYASGLTCSCADCTDFMAG